MTDPLIIEVENLTFLRANEEHANAGCAMFDKDGVHYESIGTLVLYRLTGFLELAPQQSVVVGRARITVELIKDGDV